MPKANQPNVRTRRRLSSSQDITPRHPSIELLTTSQLRAFKGNARLHSARQIGQIKNSIMQFGFMNPVLVDGENEVIAGHGRLCAAKELGLGCIPVIRVEHLSKTEIRAYRLADNKLAENSSWDESLLQIEISDLIELELEGELSFDMDTLGFETAEVDLLLSQGEMDDVNEIVADPNKIEIAKLGEVWQLGRHRILCGSALDEASYAELLSDDTVCLVLTDPPYNVRVRGHVRGKASPSHREFAMASGEMTRNEFVRFLRTALGKSVAVASPGAIVMTFMDWRHLGELHQAACAIELEQLNLCVWVKSNGGMGSLYRSQHELCGIYRVPGARHRNNVQLGRLGRNRTNVWTYAGVNTFGRNRAADLNEHPTVKPVAMIEDAIRDVTAVGDLVLDPFGGSGTTLLAAERCRRTARLIEIDPRYVDVTIRRWQDLTGETAIETESGEAWNDRASRYASENNQSEEQNDG